MQRCYGKKWKLVVKPEFFSGSILERGKWSVQSAQFHYKRMYVDSKPYPMWFLLLQYGPLRYSVSKTYCLWTISWNTNLHLQWVFRIFRQSLLSITSPFFHFFGMLKGAMWSIKEINDYVVSCWPMVWDALLFVIGMILIRTVFWLTHREEAPSLYLISYSAFWWVFIAQPESASSLFAPSDKNFACRWSSFVYDVRIL